MDLDAMLAAAGVAAWGVAEAGSVDRADMELFSQWRARGCHGTMGYLERWDHVRADPRLLLDGARTLIVCAFPYFRPEMSLFATYALGRDYHEVVRERLGAVAREITRLTGAATRVCVDSAPLRERHWAEVAGLGQLGRNCQLIVPGLGSYVFIGTIVTTLQLSHPVGAALDTDVCVGCSRCVDACPGQALDGNGGMDARRCLSYLTIEHRGDLPAPALELMARSPKVYGCDICQQVCPRNSQIPVSPIDDFAPREALMRLTRQDMAEMTSSSFRHLFAHSAVRRLGLERLRRNARAGGEKNN